MIQKYTDWYIFVLSKLNDTQQHENFTKYSIDNRRQRRNRF